VRRWNKKIKPGFPNSDLSVVVHGEGDESGVAPVDEPDSRPVHTNVQLVDDRDDRLLDPAEPRSSDAARAVQHEHQVHQPAAACDETIAPFDSYSHCSVLHDVSLMRLFSTP